MNQAILTIYNNKGTFLSENEISMPFLPRVGEIVKTNEEIDNTKEFIVTDVTYQLHNDQLFPYVSCESFYRKGGSSRLFYLKQGCWVQGHCSDVSGEQAATPQ